MSNWLEDAESKIVNGHHKSKLVEKLRLRKEAIQFNYDANQVHFDTFINELQKLVDRVNSLPVEYREQFGKISFNSKDSRLNNHLHHFSSSSRFKKRVYKGFLRFFKKYTFKRIRVAYFTVSSYPGKLDVELKENMLLRVRMTRAGENERLRYPRKKNKDRKDYRFRLDFESVGGKEAMDIIDWLAFKKEMEGISFFKQQDQLISS